MTESATRAPARAEQGAGLPKVLMVAFHFPPVAESSGIQRTLKFATYLNENGWQPIVLTVHARAHEFVNDDQMEEIPPHVEVERAFALDAARHLAFRGRYLGLSAQPDRWASWWPAAVYAGMRIIRRHRPAVLMSTYPIATAHLVGLTLARLSGLPWIADTRDSMTEPGYPVDPTTWKIHRRLERSVMRHCARAVFTTNGTREMYATRYPELPASRWDVIENGFDEANFSALGGVGGAAPGADSRITLVHSGSLYPEARDPTAFFAALGSLRAAGAIDASRLRIVLRATGSDAVHEKSLAANGIEDIVELAPSVGYSQALEEMLRADGLILFQASMCNHQIPAKLYEYFRAGRPILAITDPAGDTAGALEAAGAGMIASIRDADNIAAALTSFLSGLRDGTQAGVAREDAARYSRRRRTVELAAALDAVRAGSRPRPNA